MHSSSMSPLKSSELESSSPSHPLFMHSDQNSPRGSRQSPTCLQHCQIRTQHSPVSSWKSLRPESRATLDGSSSSPPGIQGRADIGPAPQVHVSSLQSHSAASSDTAHLKAGAAHVQHSYFGGKGRAAGLDSPVQTAVSVSHWPGRSVQSTSTHDSLQASAEGKDRASSRDSSIQPASKQGIAGSACIGCAPQHADDASAECNTSRHAPINSPSASCRVPGEVSPEHTRDVNGFVAHSFVGVKDEILSRSMQAAHFADAAAGTHCSTGRPSSAATASCAECSDRVSQSSFPLLVGCHRVRAHSSGGCQSSSASELSALNSVDLAYLERETSAVLPAGLLQPLYGSSQMASSTESSGGQQAASESAHVWASVHDAVMQEGSGNGQVLSRIGSGTTRKIHAAQCRGPLGDCMELLQNLGNGDVVPSGVASELWDQSSSCEPVAACWAPEIGAHADQCHSVHLARPAETADSGRLQSLESAIEHGQKSKLLGSELAAATSCDSLYEDDWEV